MKWNDPGYCAVFCPSKNEREEIEKLLAHIKNPDMNNSLQSGWFPFDPDWLVLK
jgi:hypothetical protein